MQQEARQVQEYEIQDAVRKWHDLVSDQCAWETCTVLLRYGLTRVDAFPVVIVNHPTEAHSKGKINRVKTSVFLEQQQQQIWALVMPREAVQALMAAKGQWSTVSEELTSVTCSSRIGKVLFSHAVQQSAMEQLKKLQVQALEKLFASATISQRDVAKMQKEVLSALVKVPNVELIPAKRTVKVPYRGVELSYLVGSLHEEVDLRVQSELKSRATDCGELVPLACEDALITVRGTGVAGQIQPAVLAGASNARKTINVELEAMGLKMGSEIQETLINAAMLHASICL